MVDQGFIEWCHLCNYARTNCKCITGVQSKATTVNPKDLLGAKKIGISRLPAVAIAHGAHAMMDGAKKYGPYNWRDKEVIASIYVDAAIRHLLSWHEGEERAEDSGVHHLGHAIACCAILLDALTNKQLVDDRPVKGCSADNYKKALNLIQKLITLKSEFANDPEGWRKALESVK